MNMLFNSVTCCYTVLHTVTKCCTLSLNITDRDTYCSQSYMLSLNINDCDTCCSIVLHAVTQCYTLSLNSGDYDT